MIYRFARERVDHSDFATGRVLVSAPGRTAFPVRLADEVFQRCLALRPDHAVPHRIVLYDPLCGSAALLATLAFLHGDRLGLVVGSDADSEALRLAERNLALFTPVGIDERIALLTSLRDQYGKESHREAVESAQRLRAMLVEPPVEASVFQADATDSAQIVAGVLRAVDVVIADVPYGSRSFWTHDLTTGRPDPLWEMLESIRPILAPSAVVAIASDKGQRPHHDAYVRREWFQVGKRRIECLTLRTDAT